MPPYCGVVADPGGVDAAEPVEPVDPGPVMLPLLDDPVAEPLDEPLRRDLLVVVVVPLVVPSIGIEPIVPPDELPIDPVGELPVMPGAVELLPVPVDVPVDIEPLAPGAAPLPPAVWAPAAAASSAAAVIAIMVFIVVLLLDGGY